jgi:hypothetical protein
MLVSSADQSIAVSFLIIFSLSFSFNHTFLPFDSDAGRLSRAINPRLCWLCCVLSPSSSAFNFTVPSLFFILNAGLVSRAINQCPAGVFSQLICILQARSMIHAALFISTSRAPYMHIKEPTKAFGLAEVEDPCRPAELACMPVCSLLA